MATPVLGESLLAYFTPWLGGCGRYVKLKRPAIIRGGCADFHARKLFKMRTLRKR